MLELNRKKLFFKGKEIWFSDPYDISNHDFVGFWSKNKLDIPGFNRRETFTLLIDLKKPLDKIYSNMRKQFVQKQIERGIRRGIKVSLSKNFKRFYKLNNEFRKFKSAAAKESLDAITQGTLFLAHQDKELLSGMLFLEDENNLRQWLTISVRFEKKEKQNLIGQANRILMWEAIKYAKNKGIRRFDLGGVCMNPLNKEKYAITLFKKSFGGKLIKMYYYEKYYSRKLRILKNLKNIIEKKNTRSLVKK